MLKRFQRKGGDRVAVVVNKLYERATEALDQARERSDVPAVDPDSANLDDLFEWGAAIAKRGNITPQRSKELRAAVRQYVKGRR